MPWKDPLLAAVMYKCSLKVKKLLQSGANPEGPLPHFITPLQLAVDNNDFTTVKFLIHCANLNSKCSSKETPLHIASLEHVSYSIFKLLVDSGADITSTDLNLWTPMHLVAAQVCLEKLWYLLQQQDPPVLAKDEEGATPMHLLVHFCDDFGKVTKLKQIIRLMLHAGYKTCTQTDEGETIFHCASQSDMLLELIIPFISQKSDLITDKQGNNFLHTYFNSRCGVEEGEPLLMNILKGNIVQIEKEIMTILLNQQNVYGKTTLLLYLGEPFKSLEVVKLFLQCGADVNISDNLGNSVLHQLLNSPSPCETKMKIMKVLLQGGANVNAKDIFERTPIFFANHMNLVRILIDSKANINMLDRCKCSPLLALLRAGKPRICQYLINRGADVNQCDKFGANALHHAAWVNMTEAISILLRCGTDINQRDRDGKTPLDVAQHWRCLESSKCMMSQQYSPKYEAEYESSSAHQDNILPVWFHKTRVINYSQLEQPLDLKCYFNIPSDICGYLECVLKTPGVGKPKVYDEANLTEAMVLTFVEAMAKHLYKLDKRFKWSVFRSGSTFEDTKVGDPDEFDFIFCLEKFQNLCTVVDNENDEMSGFLSLMVNESKTTDIYQRYFDENGLLLCKRIRSDFFDLVRRVLYCRDIWIFDEIFIDDITIHNPDEKPIVNFRLFMTGSLYKYLKISIDIVPAIRKRGWWPKTGHSMEDPFITEEIVKEGCLFLCQIPDSDDRSSDNYTKFRISCAPAEILLLKCLPVWVKESYSLSKMLKSNFMCPHIRFSPNDEDEFDKEIESAENAISSYMLKNCLFHVLSEDSNICSKITSKSNIHDILQLALKIYEYLENQAKKGCLKAYILPYVDILSFNIFDEEYDVTNDKRQTKEIKVIAIFSEMIQKLYNLRL